MVGSRERRLQAGKAELSKGSFMKKARLGSRSQLGGSRSGAASSGDISTEAQQSPRESAEAEGKDQ